jgi:hypothetical protein
MNILAGQPALRLNLASNALREQTRLRTGDEAIDALGSEAFLSAAAGMLVMNDVAESLVQYKLQSAMDSAMKDDDWSVCLMIVGDAFRVSDPTTTLSELKSFVSKHPCQPWVDPRIDDVWEALSPNEQWQELAAFVSYTVDAIKGKVLEWSDDPRVYMPAGSDAMPRAEAASLLAPCHAVTNAFVRSTQAGADGHVHVALARGLHARGTRALNGYGVRGDGQHTPYDLHEPWHARAHHWARWQTMVHPDGDSE